MSFSRGMKMALPCLHESSFSQSGRKYNVSDYRSCTNISVQEYIPVLTKSRVTIPALIPRVINLLLSSMAVLFRSLCGYKDGALHLPRHQCRYEIDKIRGWLGDRGFSECHDEEFTRRCVLHAELPLPVMNFCYYCGSFGV